VSESDLRRWRRLRARAEKAIGDSVRLSRTAPGRPGRTDASEPADPEALLYELEVNQFELTLQNEELRAARGGLERARDRLQDLFENAPVGYLVVDARGGMVEMNSVAAQLIGGRTATGTSLLAALAAGRRAHVRRWLKAHMSPDHGGSEPPLPLEIELLRTARLVRLHGRREVTAQGQPQLRIAIVDLSDQRDVLERQSLLLRAIEQSPSTVVITDADGDIVYVNPKFTGLTGYSFEEVRGRNPRLLKSGETSDEEYRELWRTISAGREWRGEFHNRKKDGTLYWERASIFPEINARGELSHYVAVKHDITREKELAAQNTEAQVLLQEMIDGIDEPVVVFEVDGSVRLQNHAAKADGGGAGLRTAVQASGLVAAVKSRPVATTRERAETDGDGRPRELIDTATPMLDEDGSLRAVIVATRDITAARRAERHQQRNARLESLGMVAGGIAHDFNNLLATIVGNVELSEEASSEPERAARTAEALQACDAARDLAGQLLTFARGGAPVLEVARVAEPVARSARFAARGSQCDVVVSDLEALWPVRIDRAQFGQVIHNLVLNAVQAIAGRGTIRISGSNVAVDDAEQGAGLSAGKWIRLTIADTGPGLSPAATARVFEPYFSTRPGGSGLGLATTHSIVTRHGGVIDVHNQPGGGAEFSIHLPATDELPAAVGPTADTPPRAGKLRLLIMDDDRAVRRAVARGLELDGHAVVEASDGDVAERLWRQAVAGGEPFAAMVADLTVPGAVGGEELVAALRPDFPEMVAIAMSGYANSDVMAEPAAHGFSAALAKPFRVRRLAALLARVMAS